MVASNVIIVGDAGSGKTALIKKIAGNKFPENHQKTIGADFIDHTINGQKLQIWAISSDERFIPPVFAQKYTKKTIAVMVCVDLSQAFSRDSVEKHINRLQTKYPSLPITLIGTKKDKADATTQQNLEAFANEKGYSFKTVSAKTGDNLNILFNEIAPPEKIIAESESESESESEVESPESAEKPIVDVKPVASKTTLLDELLTLINEQTESDFKTALLALHSELKRRHEKGKDLNNVTKTAEATITLLKGVNQQQESIDQALEQNLENQKIDPKTTKQLFKTYLNSCPYQSGLLSKLIKTVAVTGICAVAGLAVAAGICSGLGLVAVGSAAFIGGVGLLGSTAAFFHKNPLQRAIETVAKEGEKHHLDDKHSQGPNN